MLVGEGEVGEGVAEVPGHIRGEQAAEDVSADVVFPVMPDRTEIQVVDSW